ncbi:amino acid permease-domain-containing protein [Gigaspora rosea]|uniref:Amino acid permease-domain-containing protein n=1 Tax=Gigaspora rosea TaxID=44941 RepID=A0A397W4Q7_9GLOM|nr:amino acid permease-domain-containing protein [Gigaspora rosea]
MDHMNYETNIPNYRMILGILYGVGININRILGKGIFNLDIIFKLVSPGIALVLFAFCAIISLLGGLIYNELGIRSLPHGIGEQKYITDAYPKERNLGHVFSYVIIFIILPGAMVADSYNCSQYILFVFRGYFNNDYDYIAVIISVLILLVITLYHVFSKRLPDIINLALAVIKVISLIIISMIGLVRLAGTDSDNWNNIFNTSSNFDAYGFGAYGNGLIQILYAYEGWNSVNYLIEEITIPESNNLVYPSHILKYSSLISIAISFLLYFFTNAAFITVLGNGLTRNEDIPIALRFGKELLDGTGEKLMSIIVAISSFGSVSIMSLKKKILDKMDKVPDNENANDKNKPFSISKYIILFYFLIIILIIIASLFPPEYGNVEYLIPYIISCVATILSFIFWYYLNPNQNERSDNENEEPNVQVNEVKGEVNISFNNEIK